MKKKQEDSPSMARCCAYVRKSQADDPNESLEETLARHERRLREVSERNGHRITHIYREVVSGETIAAREEVKKLLDDAKEWDYVYCVREDRLARGDSIDQGLVVRAFMASGTKIATPHKVFDLDNRSDQQFFEVSLFLARMEYRFITERMKDGITDSLKEGQYLGRHTPFGYDKFTNERGQKTLVPNDDAALVKMMFHWSAVEDRSYYWIAKELTGMGVKSPRGNDTWGPTTIGEILKNEIYIGLVRWGRHKTFNAYSADGYRQAKQKKIVDDYDLYEGLHEPLVGRELYEQSMRNTKSRPPVHHGDAVKSPLAGLIVCGNCGRAMCFIHDRRFDTYRWQHKNNAICNCKGCKGERAELIMEAIQDHLRKTMEEMEVLVTDDGAEKEAQRIKDTIETLRKDLAAIDRAQEVLLETLESGNISPELFGKRNAMHEERRAKVEAAIAELGFSIPQQAAVKERIVRLSECIDAIGSWRENAETVNRFLKGFVEKIEYYNDSEYGKHDKLVLDISFLPAASSSTV